MPQDRRERSVRRKVGAEIDADECGIGVLQRWMGTRDRLADVEADREIVHDVRCERDDQPGYEWLRMQEELARCG